MDRFTALALAAALSLPAWAAFADTVTLKDGTVREGQIVKQDEQGVTLEVRVGGMKGALVIPRSEIASIQQKALPPEPVEAEAARLRGQAEALKGAAAAEAWVKLGDLYSGKLGYSAQAREAYEKAIQADPENAAARARVGHVKTAGGWQKVEDERRDRGLVPLGEVWVRPDERSWLIDRRHEQEVEELRIGPRRDDAFTRLEIEKALALKKAEEEAARRERLRLAYGESLLSRYGYYVTGDGIYIGSGWTPYWVDGVGLSTLDSEFFVGRIGSGYWQDWGCYPWLPCWRSGHGGHGQGHGGGHGHGGPEGGHGHGGGPGGGHGGCQHPPWFSPGFRWGNFSFGTNLNPYGNYPFGAWCSPGSGIHIQGGSGSFRYNVNLGGWGGAWHGGGSTGMGF